MLKRVFEKVAKNKSKSQLLKKCGNICGKSFPLKNKIFHRKIKHKFG